MNTTVASRVLLEDDAARPRTAEADAMTKHFLSTVPATLWGLEEAPSPRRLNQRYAIAEGQATPYGWEYEGIIQAGLVSHLK